MPDILFHAFLSCSLTSEDTEVVDMFKRLVRSFDIDPFVYDYQELGRIPDKVKEHIIKSDCLIAIATRRKKIEGLDLWACPDWIQHEIALAHAYEKPVAIFFEDGVKIEGLLETEERRQKFLRSDLLRDIDKIARFLFSLRTHLESSYQIARISPPNPRMERAGGEAARHGRVLVAAGRSCAPVRQQDSLRRGAEGADERKSRSYGGDDPLHQLQG